MYACGVILWELASRREPFADVPWMAQVEDRIKASAFCASSIPHLTLLCRMFLSNLDYLHMLLRTRPACLTHLQSAHSQDSILFISSLYQCVCFILTSLVFSQAGERPPMPESCLAPLRTLIEACWAHDPRTRPDFPAVVLRLESALAELPNPPPPFTEVPSHEFNSFALYMVLLLTYYHACVLVRNYLVSNSYCVFSCRCL